MIRERNGKHNSHNVYLQKLGNSPSYTSECLRQKTRPLVIYQTTKCLLLNNTYIMHIGGGDLFICTCSAYASLALPFILYTLCDFLCHLFYIHFVTFFAIYCIYTLWLLSPVHCLFSSDRIELVYLICQRCCNVPY